MRIRAAFVMLVFVVGYVTFIAESPPQSISVVLSTWDAIPSALTTLADAQSIEAQNQEVRFAGFLADAQLAQRIKLCFSTCGPTKFSTNSNILLVTLLRGCQKC